MSIRSAVNCFRTVSLWGSVAAFLLLACIGCNRRTEVETASPHKGEIQESFTEPGQTRLAKTWLITMPVSGRIGRIDLEPGDEVRAGQVLVEFDLVPFVEAVAEAKGTVAEIESRIAVKDSNALEATILLETKELTKAAQEVLRASDEQVKAEQARSERASKERARVEALAVDEVVTEAALDDARLAAETALIELKRQQFYRAATDIMLTIVRLGPRYVEEYLDLEQLQRETVVHQLAQARSRLVRAEHELGLASIRSPIDGVVLERYEQGDRTLAAGQGLLLLGNLDELEVVVDVLTQDALRLKVGGVVLLESALGRTEIAGEVKRIEPAGFTKLSSLGVEQQRVNVIVGFHDRPGKLGVGYRLQARFITGAKEDALTVPRFSVLQALDRSFYVLKVMDGRLRRAPVRIGLRSDLELEVTEGLTTGDLIVARPDTTMRDGMKVKSSPSGE